MKIDIQKAEQKLISILPDDVKKLSSIFNENNFKLFLVGGCVRDVLVGKDPKDFDVCTDAMPDQVIELLTKNNIRNQLQGEAFGVVVARMSEDFEVATFRTDISANNGKNSEDSVILGVTIDEDVKRRDLTCNALFLDIETGKIIDLVGGIKDIEDEIIVTVGNPEDRFKEDNLRKLRTIRFANRLGFKIHSDTFNAIKKDASLNVSSERIVNELKTSFDSCKNIDILISDLIDSKLIFEIFKDSFINTFASSDNIFSFTSFIAELLDDSDSINKHKSLESLLIDTKLPSKLINGVIFLLEGHKLNIINFMKKLKSVDLTDEEIITFHKESNINIEKWCKFKIPSDLSTDLMNKGFKGKELGDEILSICNNILNN